MLVRQSTYDALATKFYILRREHSLLLDQWNALCKRINALGGESFLQKGEAQTVKSTFTGDEIEDLIRLCHPDRHDNKPSSIRMTQKLLSLRKKT